LVAVSFFFSTEISVCPKVFWRGGGFGNHKYGFHSRKNFRPVMGNKKKRGGGELAKKVLADRSFESYNDDKKLWGGGLVVIGRGVEKIIIR